MPPDLLALDKKRDQVVAVSFKRPIFPADLSRLAANARRVCRLTTSSPFLAAEEFHMLSMAAGGRWLLPNLNQLIWTVENDNIFPFISLFLGSKIKEIHLSLIGATFVRLSLLATLNLQYPSLTHVNITGHNTSVIAADIVSAAVCGWNQLRHLSVNSLSIDALQHLAALPLLENLTLRNVGKMILPDFPPSQGVSRFPSLRSLNLKAGEILYCLALVKIMSSTPLRSVRFSICTPSTSSQWGGLSNALHDHCNHDSMTSIMMDSPDFNQYIHGSVLSPDHPKALYVFSNINVLDLRLGYDFEPNNGDVREMALAWPRIRTLTIQGCFKTKTPRVTVLGLIPFAQYCRELQRLSIAFDPSPAPSPMSNPQVFYSTALTYLDVQASPIVKPFPVAAFLSDIFPKLSIVTHENSKHKQN